ncbi:MAG: sugar phosphate isomerase/epimerase [Kiritimatiellae bacterium]|nr:sugar phosphate isomerase/epimerase [Verrucomicrobiota bacterium]MCG2659907.1 sugar phosphate isomerase/epimerase [Kiritimatiellia bacterium]
MNTSCSSWSYHRTIAAKKMDLMAWVRECAALGLDGVELLGNHFPGTDRAYLVELKKLCADLYLTVAMVSADGHLTVSDDAQRQKEIEAIRKWVEVAAFLGAPRVRFFCGSGAELTAGGSVLFQKVKQAVAEVAALGAAHGIVMAMENHGGTTADQLLALMGVVHSPWLKLTMDTGNFPPTSQVGPETYASIERCAPQAAIVHAKFFNVKPDGSDSEFDWQRIHGLLQHAGFRGFLSIEYEGKDDNEVAVVKRIAGFLKTLR